MDKCRATINNFDIWAEQQKDSFNPQRCHLVGEFGESGEGKLLSHMHIGTPSSWVSRF